VSRQPAIAPTASPRRWFLGFWLALALLGGVLGGCAAPSEDLVALADRSTESDLTPERRRAQLRLELARAYLEQGQTWVALDEVKQALSLSPDIVGGWSLRGVVYAQLGDAPRAQASFERALALAPNDVEAAYNQAWLACQHPGVAQDRKGQAQTLLARVLAQAGADGASSSRLWLALATCQARAGQADRALDSLGQPGLHKADVPETLWLAAKLARRLDNGLLAQQLGGQLRQRFGRSPQAAAFDKGAWDE
jgi:type IV pilus assembly protein PilF